MADSNGNTCETCNFFRQHYMYWRGKFRRVGYGHCSHASHCRQCRPDKRACPDWAVQEEDYPHAPS